MLSINSLHFHFLQMAELSKLLRELKSTLYGNSESEPNAETCAQLTQEFFRENTFRLLIVCLPKLNLEVKFFIICKRRNLIERYSTLFFSLIMFFHFPFILNNLLAAPVIHSLKVLFYKTRCTKFPKVKKR